MKMHFKNEAEINTNTCNSTKTTTSSTSSTDSGIIIVDNVNNNNNNNNTDQTLHTAYTNNVDKGNNNINSNRNSNNAKDNEHNAQLNAAPQQQQTQHNANIYTSDMYNNNNKNKHINIENIINIDNAQMSQKNATSRPSHSPSMPQRTPCQLSPSQSPLSDHRLSLTKHSSPAVSIRSTTISIVSIDENAIDSSIVDSDSEREADAEGAHGDYVVKRLGQQTTYPPNSSDVPDFHKGFKVIGQQISPHGGAGGSVVPLAEQVMNGGLALAQPASTTPQIGSIALTNSTDVTFGDKHFYEGPVTIQQFLIDGRDKWKANPDDDPHGHDNPAFAQDQDGNPINTAPKSAANLPPHEKTFSFISNRKAIVVTSVIVLLTLFIGIIILVSTNILDAPFTQTPADEYTFNGTLKQLDRSVWGGRPARTELDNLVLPVHRVIISHTASETCNNKIDCAYRCRIIQDYHMDSFKWDDIGYNFLIGGDGIIYVGRGWDKQGAHTRGYNVDSIGISFIGTFTTKAPTSAQLQAAPLLIAEGVRLGKLTPDYRLYGHRQMSGTESPGETLYHIIRKWPHWSDKI